MRSLPRGNLAASRRSVSFEPWFASQRLRKEHACQKLAARDLERGGMHTELLDGDEVRSRVCRGGLGFSRADRDENIRRIGYVAKVIERCGSCAVAAAISPYRGAREEVRSSVSRFVEVYTECPLAVLVERDPKRALQAGRWPAQLPHFTGVDDPYEFPRSLRTYISRTDLETKEESLARVLSYLTGRSGIPLGRRIS